MIVHFVMGRRTQQSNRVGAFVTLEYDDDNDSVRTSNEGIAYKKFLEDISGDFITEDINKEFEIVIKISNVKRIRKTDVKRTQQTVNIDYNRLVPSIPLWVINNCMDIYRALRKELRSKHAEYLAEEEREEKMRQKLKESDNSLPNSEESHS